MKRARHRWKVVAPVTSVCTRCGLARFAYGRGPRRVLSYSHPHQCVIRKLPPCTGTWPDGWAPQYRQLVAEPSP